MNKIGLVRLGVLNTSERDGLAAEIHETLQQPAEKSALRERNFRGTLSRYGRHPGLAQENLTQAAILDRMRNTGFTGFAITSGDKFLPGLVTIIDDLEVRRQYLPLPAFLTRRIGVLTVANGISDKHDNVAGWTARKIIPDYDSSFKPTSPLEEIYSLAGEEADRLGKRLWTFEPDNLAHTVADIERAGFDVSSEGWYDDGECRLAPAPKGTLLVR